MNRFRTGTLLAVLLGLVGCEDSNAVYVEHLAIVNINPSHGAVRIGYDTDISVTFSDVLDASTVGANSVCFTLDTTPSTVNPDDPCASALDSEIDYDPSTLSVVLVPDEELLPDSRYTIHLTPGLQGTKAGGLPATVRASFRTIPTN